IDKKRFTLNVEVFREIFWICPNLLNQEIDALHSDEEIVSFIRELGHKGDIKSITKVVVDQMYQPLRTFDAIIKKCLSGKITVYGALLPEVMPNQKMQDSPAYKTYLAYATGAETPKKARKFKKPSSPSKKRTLVTVEEEEPEPAKKVKKAPATTDRSKGINLLSEAALLEVAQVKKVLKRSRRETTIHQAGGSGDGVGFQPEVPDEPKGKSVDTHEGTGDDEDFQDSDDDLQQADDERTDFENQEINDYEEESANEFVHTPEDYGPTNDETNDETKDVDEEEYDRIDKELYGDVNVRLIDVEQDDEGEEDAYMTNDAHVHVEQTQEQTAGVQEESDLEMASIQVVSMLDINVQHEVPRTSPLLTILISVIPEHTIFNPSKTVTTSPATTITSLFSSLFPSLQQSHPVKVLVIPEKTQQQPSTPPAPLLLATEIPSTQVSNSEAVNYVVKRFTALEQVVKELKQDDHFAAILALIRSQVPSVVKNYLGTSLPRALKKAVKEALEKTPHSLGQSSSQGQSAIQAAEFLFEYELKKILYDKMHKRKSNQTHATHQELFDALTWSLLLDEANIKKAGLNQVKKTKKRKFNESESSKKTSTAKESSKGKSLAKTYKSGKSMTAKELVFEKASDDVQQTFDDKMDIADVSQADTDPKITKKDWFKDSQNPEALTNQLEWANPEGHKRSFDMSKALPLQDKEGQLAIPVEFFFNNDLQYLVAGNKERTYSSSITKTPDARYTIEGIEDMIPTLWSPVVLVYDKDADLGISHWGP
ncbi:hypothetical protein Tco_0625246, partial [Tanacetum coccineum]